jgi:hypothetical protein
MSDAQHPTQSVAERVQGQLAAVQGVIAVAVRAQADVPDLDTVRAQAEHDVVSQNGNYPPAPMIEKRVDELMAQALNADAPPFPHVQSGTPELCRYLRSLTDLLAPVDEDRIDAKIQMNVGAMRLVAESWDHLDDPPLLVAVAIPQNHPGVKSLMRALRRVRKKNQKAQ